MANVEREREREVNAQSMRSTAKVKLTVHVLLTIEQQYEV